MRYLVEWRMERARELLAGTDLTISAIADATGYHSEFSFSKAFKRVYGVTPGTVRRETARLDR